MNRWRCLAVIVAFFLPAVSRAADAPRPLMRDFLGLCGHTVQFKPDLYAPVCSLARDYHPVEWDLANKTEVLPDFPEAKNRVDWNEIYGSWKKAGFRTDVCLMFDTIAPDHWHNLDADASAYASAFAREFGPGGKLPLVQSVEIGNEPGNYSDAQYEQLLTATLPAIRRADAKLRTASCNLTIGKSTKYAKSVDTLLADPAILPDLDVLTLHTYAFAEQWPTWRRSFPEDPSIKYLADINDLTTWRDAHAPGKAVWVTEFGYDATTKKPDAKSDFARWVGVSDTQQAKYLVRSALVFSAMPVERAYIYFFNDNDEPSLHASSGITRNFQPKPAYYALAHLQQAIGNCRFAKVLLAKPGDVYAYEYTNADAPDHRVIVAWSPTGSGRKSVAAIPLPAGTHIIKAQRMPLTKEAVDDVNIASASEVAIDESPLYLFVESNR